LASTVGAEEGGEVAVLLGEVAGLVLAGRILAGVMAVVLRVMRLWAVLIILAVKPMVV
jgi:hypothetical protein